LHAFAKQITKAAKEETKRETTGMSFYAKNQNKREKRVEDKLSWGAQNAWTNTDSMKNNFIVEAKTSANNIVPFNQNEMSNHTKDVQALFSNRNKERRKNNELDE
jgi:hypothetical protein